MSLIGILAAIVALSGQTDGRSSPVDPNLIRVYVHTSNDETDARQLAARQESVTDLAASLATKKKVLSVVYEKDQADIDLEVIERGWTVPKVVIGMGTRPGELGGPGSMAMRAVQLRVRLRAPKRDDVEFRNKNAPLEANRGAKSAADDIAKQIEKWVTDHRAKLRPDPVP